MRAVYPGSFDPFTRGHLDIADRARRLFPHLTLLVAVNDEKHPATPPPTRAAAVRALLPTVTPWTGLTADFCHRHGPVVIIRGVRNNADLRHEQQLAAMNEALGVTTLLLSTRPALASVSSTAARALGQP
jgi:pantetheine-phosphate adenylyltransferase